MQDTQETSLSTVSKPKPPPPPPTAIIRCSSCCCRDCCTRFTRRTRTATTSNNNSSTSTVLGCTRSASFVVASGRGFDQQQRRYYFGMVPIETSSPEAVLPVKGGSRRGRNVGRERRSFWRWISGWRRVKQDYEPASTSSTFYSNPDYCLGATLKL